MNSMNVLRDAFALMQATDDPAMKLKLMQAFTRDISNKAHVAGAESAKGRGLLYSKEERALHYTKEEGLYEEIK